MIDRELHAARNGVKGKITANDLFIMRLDQVCLYALCKPKISIYASATVPPAGLRPRRAPPPGPARHAQEDTVLERAGPS